MVGFETLTGLFLTMKVTVFRDTVSSVGMVRQKTLPYTAQGMGHVCLFRHALALDECRVKFLPEYAHGGRTVLPGSDRTQGPSPHTKEVWFSGTHSDM